MAQSNAHNLHEVEDRLKKNRSRHNAKKTKKHKEIEFCVKSFIIIWNKNFFLTQNNNMGTNKGLQ